MKNLGCRGLFVPVTMDNEGTYSFSMSGWGAFMTTASWVAQHYYKHFEYTGDMDFLKNRAYPFFREVARFWQDFLFYDKNGVAQICPSASPENTFIPDCDIWSTIGQSCAHDVQLCYDVFGYAIRCAELLGEDGASVPVWKKLRQDLPEFKIGSDGRLMEWEKEFPEKEPGHRHFSHLYGAFPGELFTSETRKDRWEAALKSLEYRLSHEGGHTGWSRAWTACLFARFGKSGEFYDHLNHLITDFSTASLLDLHPPKIFQIDGNLGGAEAILQALVQSRDGKIFLLYALPEVWESGEIKGVKTVGGHTLGLSWDTGKLAHIDVTVGFGEKGILVLPDGKEIPFCGAPGTQLQFDI